MPPTNNWEKLPQTAQEFQAARLADRFFCDARGKAEGIKYLAEAQCFSALVDAVELLNQAVKTEVERRAGERFRQMEIEGLLSASDRAAVNQAEMRL